MFKKLPATTPPLAIKILRRGLEQFVVPCTGLLLAVKKVISISPHSRNIEWIFSLQNTLKTIVITKRKMDR